MRISKRQLRKIIREEKKKILNESFSPMRSRVDPYLARQFSSKGDITEAPYGPVGAEEYNAGYARDKNRATMSEKTATVIQLLQTVHMNLNDISAGLDEEAYNEVSAQLVLIEDAVHALGGNLP